MKPIVERLNGYLRRYTQKFGEPWKLYDEFRSTMRAKHPWPDWCFCPVVGSVGIVASLLDRAPETLGAYENDFAVLAGLAAWRKTKGIYVFDETLREALTETPIAEDIPSEVLRRLPEWCLYVPLPGEPCGFFAFLEHNIESGMAALCLLLDMGDELQSLIIELGGTIEEGMAYLDNLSPEWKPREQFLRRTSEIIGPLVNLLLYLASENAEVRDRRGKRAKPENPKPVATRRGMKSFPAGAETMWDVGYRMGPALRKAFTETTGGEASGTKVRPHIRRGHWHKFIAGVGSRTDPAKRVYRLKWLPPIPVNIGDEELPATVRPIKP